MNVFTDDELQYHFKLPQTLLPSKNDVLRFVLPRTYRNTKTKHDTVVREMAINVSKIWNDADCCPYTPRHIIAIFERDVWSVYLYLNREGHLPGAPSSATNKKRSHKKDPTKTKKYTTQTQRRSSRIDSASGLISYESNESILHKSMGTDDTQEKDNETHKKNEHQKIY